MTDPDASVGVLIRAIVLGHNIHDAAHLKKPQTQSALRAAMKVKEHRNAR